MPVPSPRQRKHSPQRLLTALTLATTLAATAPLSAQTTPTPGPSAGTSLPEDPERIGQLISQAETGAAMDDTTRASVVQSYRAAIDNLTERDRLTAETERFEKTLAEGPERLRQYDGGETEADTPPADGSMDSLFLIESSIASLRSRERELEARLDNLGARSPEVLRASLAETRTQREAVRQELATRLDSRPPDDPPSLNHAQLTELNARLLRLDAEVAMLEKEELSHPVRVSLTQAEIERTRERIGALERQLQSRQSEEVRRLAELAIQAEDTVRTIENRAQPATPQVAALATTLTEHARQVRQTLRRMAAATEAIHRKKNLIEDIRQSHRYTREFLDHEGMAGEFATILFDQLRMIRQPDIESQLLDTQSLLFETRREIFALRGQADGALNKLAPDPTASRRTNPDPAAPSDTTATGQARIEEMEALADRLSEELIQALTRLENQLVELQGLNTEIRSEIQTFRDYTIEKLFWVRSSPAVGLGFLHELGGALDYCFGPGRLAELGQAMRGFSVATALLLGLALALLLGFRRVFLRALKTAAQRTRRISTDTYSHTLTALLLTTLLSLPIPLLLWGIALLLNTSANATAWTDGLADGLGQAGLLFAGIFLMNFCRPHGLGEAHVGWPATQLRRLRRITGAFLPVYMAASILLTMTLSEQSAAHLNSLGRLTLLVLIVSAGSALALVFHPERGVAAAVHAANPESWLGKSRHTVFRLIVGGTALLGVLLLAGYVVTGLLLIRQLELTVLWLFLAFLLYGMLLRGCVIRERKLRLQELLAARQARQRQEVEAPPERESEARVLEIETPEEEPIDMRVVQEQTRHLIGFVVGAILFVRLWLIWTEFAPVVDFLDRIEAFGGISLSDVGLIALILAIVIALIRNLPGLLEVAVFSRVSVVSGTRNAVITLAQYGIIVAGAVFLFNQIGIDWAQFGWIAAALSVGIGFGLQEVVANFISGLILLFERQVRPGDVVTVDSIDGIVSRIQIRATTITGWDCREYVVPNKNFVTGTFLNWTLSSTMNRAVIVVGVAYGSDTGLARRILAEVAADHPNVLDDPKPMATFEEFGDSALKLVLRAYIPNMDNRLTTISELHTEIDRRLKEAGIEIAFPQMDLHIRDVNQQPPPPDSRE